MLLDTRFHGKKRAQGFFIPKTAKATGVTNFLNYHIDIIFVTSSRLQQSCQYSTESIVQRAKY